MDMGMNMNMNMNMNVNKVEDVVAIMVDTTLHDIHLDGLDFFEDTIGKIDNLICVENV